MSRFQPILKEYASILKKKTKKQLILIAKELDLRVANLTKDLAISHIVARTEKDEKRLKQAQQFVENARKLQSRLQTTTPKPPISFATFPEQQSVSPTPAALSKSVAHILSLQRKQIESYSRAYSKTKLSQLLKYELIPETDNYFKLVKAKERQDMKVRAAQAKREEQRKKKIKEEVVEVEGYRQYNRLYVIDDRQEMEKPKEDWKELANNSGIQTQIIYPQYLIKKDHENPISQQTKTLVDNDIVSVNRYINENLSSEILRITEKKKKKRRIKKLSECLFYMQLIKESEYSREDPLARVLGKLESIDKLQGKGKGGIGVEEVTELLGSFEKYREYYETVLMAVQPQIVVKLAQMLFETFEKYLMERQQMNNANSTFAISILNFCMKIVSIRLHNETEEKQSDELVQLTEKLSQKWLQICSTKQLYNAQDLNLLLQGLTNFAQVSSQMMPLPETLQADYQNITKQTLYGLQQLLQTSSPSQSQSHPPESTPLTLNPALINSIIINFEQICGEDEVPEGVIANLVVHACGDGIDGLPVEGRRALVRLLGARTVIGRRVVAGNLVQRLLRFAVGLDAKQVLLAIELVKNYEINNPDRLIYSLITQNIDPSQLQPTIQPYFIKLANQRLTNSQTRQSLLNYLNLQP